MPETNPPDGFTPVSDQLVKTHGLIAAAVWGRMWRYAQMQDGVCRASFRTLAEDLGIGKNTVIRSIQALEAGGLLVDTTPGAVKTPHRYQCVTPSVPTVGTESIPAEGTDEKHLYPQRAQSVPKSKQSVPTVGTKDTKTQKTLNTSGEGKPKRASCKDPPDPRVKAVVVGFQELVGYKLTKWAAESKAAKDLLAQGFEAGDIYECWRYLQTDSFWTGKHCSLQSVANNIGPWVKAGRPASRQNGSSHAGHSGSAGRSTTFARRDGHSADDIKRIVAEREAEERAREAASGG